MPQVYGKCPFPNCKRRVIQGQSSHGFCVEHEKFVNDLLFILPHIKTGQARSSGIVLPGDKDFLALKSGVVKGGQ